MWEDDYENSVSESFDEFLATTHVNSWLLLASAAGHFESNFLKRLNDHRLTKRDYNTDEDIRGCRSLELFRSELSLKTKEFEGKVWFDRKLKDYVRRNGDLSGTYKTWNGYRDNPEYDGCEIKVLYCAIAGRALITFSCVQQGCNKDPVTTGTDVTFITEDGSDRHVMGWQSCNGKTKDILKLCNIATYQWGNARSYDEETDFSKLLVPDENVLVC